MYSLFCFLICNIVSIIHSFTNQYFESCFIIWLTKIILQHAFPMEIDYSQENNHKCPYCNLTCPELDRFKQHLINCRKCNDMSVYVCRHYFGHVFPQLEGLQSHYEHCIFKNGPILYADNKRIKLGKSAKEQITNEYYPVPMSQSSASGQSHQRHSNPAPYPIDQVVPIFSDSIATISRAHREVEIEAPRTENKDVFHYYIYEDIPTTKTFNLMYSF